jgi:hypothetical protein
MKKYISTLGISLFFAGLCTVANAQKLDLNKGDEYKITTNMSSSMAMKRGDKQLDFKSVSSITKAYNVTEADDNGYKLNITTTHIADTIDAFNQKLAYNTNRAADASSAIETALSKLIGETQTLSLDKSGKITEVGDLAKATNERQVAAMAGLYNKSLANGNTFNFGSSFKLPTGANVGTTWNENNSAGRSTSKTTFTVEFVSATNTRVGFKSEESQPGSATNMNGVLLMDNATGVILQRVIKMNTVSNEEVDGKTYVVSRKNTISEACVKVK